MRIYATLLVICVVALAVLDVTTRSNLSEDHPDQLVARYHEAKIRAASGDSVYAGRMLRLIQRENLRRKANTAIPLFMALMSLVYLGVVFPRWLRARRSPIPKIRGIVELMNPEELVTSGERFKEVQDVSFKSRADAVTFLQKAAPAERKGEVLGQVWKQIHYAEVDGKRKKLGSVWIAQLRA